ncbi:hypothetical protein AB0C59_32080 [Streptomyces sp. NPDC048664]|uniref:NucA/NucB deoxyribonuclease domain-containing protein n=1 Tax=Streptomyces sp. NPDC048664 TaxID=3154505 RepID=UPI00343F321B
MTRTFSELRSMPSAYFAHTVRYAPGQGTGAGATDVVFGVYEPVVTATLPPGWVGDSPAVAKLPLLAPRWDAGRYLRNPTGGSTQPTGAQVPSATWPLSCSAPRPPHRSAEAAHDKKAYTTPGATKPLNHNKKIGGQVPSDPLHRLYLDDRRRKTNHARAVANCRRYFGPNYTENNTKDCDEFPFRSTYEGVAQSEFDLHAEKNNFSVLPVISRQNQDAGILLGQFYKKNRVIDGMDDGFLIEIIS